MSEHARWMTLALAEARQALGPCHPNPAVGALVVDGGQILGRGHTQPPGGAHAEVGAIADYLARVGGKASPTATLYVTLEPCCTHGRTPPCTERILRSGLRRVVVGATDPNPRHAGRGFALLREAGVEVLAGIEAAACADLNRVFHHWMETGRALFAAKVATTLDGRIATRTGHSRWITGEAARQDVAAWRRAFPAIAVGGGTVLADDPALTARVPDLPVWCPRRLVFDRRGQALARPEARVFTDEWAPRTLYLTSAEVADRAPTAWRAAGVEVRVVPPDWEAVRRALLDEGLTGVYFEGGSRLLSDLLAARQLDYLFAYRAPCWLGDEAAPGPFRGFSPGEMGAAWRLRSARQQLLGDDCLVHGWIDYPP